MPELPEVETTRAGLAPHIIGHRIAQIESRVNKLRQTIDQAQLKTLIARQLSAIHRRGKYLIIDTDNPTLSLLIHLGMSGSLRIVPLTTPRKSHDHILITLDNTQQLRLHDPRKFGSFLLINPQTPHPLLAHLGVEPLSAEFTGQYLYNSSRNRRSAIKTHLMNQEIIVGIGNIYASEALFLAKIHPNRPANSITLNEAEHLVSHIKTELQRAITLGGTTLRDFIHPDGTHGYFQQTLQVYGQTGNPCPRCHTPIEKQMIGQRNSFYCPNCQPIKANT